MSDEINYHCRFSTNFDTSHQSSSFQKLCVKLWWEMDDTLTVVKSISFLESIDYCQIDFKIENLMNLQHSCIAFRIWCIFFMELSGKWKFKTLQFYATKSLLTHNFSDLSIWWTSIMKTNAIAGIVFGFLICV
jgi:hypothetical protein